MTRPGALERKKSPMPRGHVNDVLVSSTKIENKAKPL
jgi:hypothetical protein